MTSEQTPLLDAGKLGMSRPAFGKALSRPQGGQLPQAIGHRGYRAAFPENSMAAFRGAVAIGAHAIETDIHLSKDEVVVLSHDPSLKRCFGKDEKIADCTWEYLSTLKTVKEPQQSLPRLSDLLEYLAQPEQEHIWMLIDIKTDDDAETLLKRTAETIASVPSSRPWNHRIALGGWTETHVEISKELFPDFEVAYIGTSMSYGRRFLKQPGVHFNLLQQILVGPIGARFLSAIRKAERNLYVWTVNREEWMEWCIRKQVDGVITDDPKLFLDVCRRWEEQPAGKAVGKRLGLRMRAELTYDALIHQLIATLLTVVHWYRRSRAGKKKQA